MSLENVDTIRGIYEAFGKGDIPAVLAALDPNVEWREADNFIYADQNPYMGPNAVLGVFMRIVGEWDDFQVAPGEIHDAGESVISTGHYSGSYKKTGLKVRAQFAHFFTFSDGKIVKFQQYTDTAQFLKATG